MTDRPILFSAPMVRALLSGTKTQTRRVLKPQPPDTTHQVSTWHHPDPRQHFFAWTDNGEGGAELADDGWCKPCPYGQPGDRLWVRESHWWFRDEYDPETGYFPPKLTADDVEYRADGEKPDRIWRPSIHMHRWASRITLEVTDVRVENLNSISEADAIAEGVNVHSDHHGKPRTSIYSPVQAYRDLWESINGPGSWALDPWVWCVSFKRVTP